MIPYEPMKMQEEILKFWTKNKIPDKIVDFKPGKKKKFYLLDGPPYVNGVPHVGHVRTTTMKDVWSKFKTMQGYQSWWQPGFDCGGLPIENAVEKKLKIKSKKDIENVVGVDKFIDECKKMAEGNTEVWLNIYKKLGAWRGWVDPYMTYKNYYLESGWWTIKKMFEKGLFVEGYRPGFWCSHCETVLTGYEVTDSYADLEDTSIFVKFPVKGRKNEYFLVWTTTPWTLPSNVSIAVHPDETYVKAEVEGETIILAEKRLEILQQMEIGYTIKEKMKGKDLEGVSYEPVLEVPIQKSLDKNPKARKVIVSIPIMKQRVSSKATIKSGTTEKDEFGHIVTMDIGSGLVHIAPGHGDVDNKIGKHYGMPELSPVDEEGKLTRETGQFSGIYVKDADPKIIEHLKEKNLIFKVEKIVHSYPLCWRCKTPIIYRMSKQWFLKVDMIKDKMINENKVIKWLPPFAKERMHNLLIDAPDWAITRQRFWGIPTPVWICDKCETMKVIGSLDELKTNAIEKVEKEMDIHKNTVDNIHLKCGCGSKMTRVPDIMDVWFDSGIAPWASLGYPNMNKDIFESLWPMDMVCEGQDHIRGWFYALLFMSTSTFDMSSFKSCSMTGWVLDGKGDKMSKSLGNVVYGEDALKDLDADTIRLYYCWNIAPWETQNFNLSIARELKRVLSVLWNSAMFAMSYADMKLLDKKIDSKDMMPEDRWMISRVNSVIESTTKDLENFRLHYAGRNLGDFILNDFSRWYIKIIRNRLSPWYEGKDKESAQFTMLYVLENVLRLMAPLTPYITEKIYQTIFAGKGPKSIHLSTWPKAEKVMINKDAEKEMEEIKLLIETINSLRQTLKIKIRWPVSKLYIKPENKKFGKSVKSLESIIRNLGNVEEVILVDQIPKKEKKTFEHGEICLGEILKDQSLVRELVRSIQVSRKKESLNVNDKIDLHLSSDKSTEAVLKKFEKEIINGVGAGKIHTGPLKKEAKGTMEFDGKKVSVYFEKL